MTKHAQEPPDPAAREGERESHAAEPANAGEGHENAAGTQTVYETSNKPGSSETAPEPVPPVHVLLARQEKERQETEDLLAGFDRPGRTPKPPPSSKRDFVAHYATPRVPKAAPTSERPRTASPEASTFVLPRKRGTLRAYAPWALLGALMALLGLFVAILVFRTTEGSPLAGPGVETGASAATTITGAASLGAPDGRDEIPPPEPVDTASTDVASPVTITTSLKQDPKPRVEPNGSAAALSPSHGPSRPAPRQDFIRDF